MNCSAVSLLIALSVVSTFPKIITQYFSEFSPKQFYSRFSNLTRTKLPGNALAVSCHSSPTVFHACSHWTLSHFCDRCCCLSAVCWCLLVLAYWHWKPENIASNVLFEFISLFVLIVEIWFDLMFNLLVWASRVRSCIKFCVLLFCFLNKEIEKYYSMCVLTLTSVRCLFIYQWKNRVCL